MGKYINKEELQKAIQRKKPGPANWKYTGGFNDAIMRVKSIVSKFPSVDFGCTEVNTGYQPRGPLEFSAACLVCKNNHFPKGNVCKYCLAEIKSGFVLDCTKVFELAGRKEDDKE